MFFFQNLTAELFLLESPDDSYFPKSGGSTFLKTVGSHFSEICGNKITAYKYPNNLLNYGYAVLRAMVARALVCVGLLPTLGIHHHNRYNAYCLADDIMEPYRPYVDRFVLGMMESMEPENDLRKETKATLLGIPVIDVSINGVRSPLMVAVMTTANSLCKCFRNECRKIIYPDM